MSDNKPICGILAGEPEIIGERCADGATCHHRCAAGCWRRTSCAPLSGSGLRYDWSPVDPSLSGLRDAAGDRFEVPIAWLSGPAPDEREAPIEVATAILGGIFHGGSGPELGEIDIEVCMPALEAIQCETVNSSDDVFLPLMTVAQHERIVAALTRPAQTAPQPVSSALADVAADSLEDGCRGIAGLDHRFTPGPFSGARYCSKCGVAEDPDAARAAMRTYLGLDSEDA